jgi:2-iminoacetate synthase
MEQEKINPTIITDEARKTYKAEHHDPMVYEPGMDVLPSTMLADVERLMTAFEETTYTDSDVLTALSHEHLSPHDFGALLSPAALPHLEAIAQKAKTVRNRYFGNSVCLFTPLYIANYCENYCIYCGFNCHNRIHRARLDHQQMEEEMKAIADTGLEEILILTGESSHMSPVSYIGEACKMARRYFRIVGLEIYPVNVKDYRYLHECGCDFVTVFQETYDHNLYGKLHLAGNKRVFPYRFYTQERAILGGMRGVGLGALLGLSDFRRDAFATGLHGYLLQRKYPQAEIAFSCPRLRPIKNNNTIYPMGVGEKELLQICCAYRLFMPSAPITVSTREVARVRDALMQIATTKISAGVSTGIGAHSHQKDEGDDQFEIADHRSVSAVYSDLLKEGMQPVMANAIFI